jgi:hypothetical protein
MDRNSQIGLKQYIEASQERENELKNITLFLPEKYAVWGTGTLTLRMLANGLILAKTF